MAYNSLKRIFGETKLELKLLFLFGVGLLVIIATAFWWYGSNTAQLVYDQNRDTAQFVLQEHMVATHLGADKIQSNLPAWLSPSPEEFEHQRQLIEAQRKQFSKHAGEVKMVWSHDHPKTDTPRDQDEADICKKLLSEPHDPSKSDETEYEKRIDEREYRYFEPIRGKPGVWQ